MERKRTQGREGVVGSSHHRDASPQPASVLPCLHALLSALLNPLSAQRYG